MKDFYDFSKMQRITNPLQHKIDSGELKLIDPFDISEEEFQEKLKLLNEDQREFALERRQRWKDKQLLQEISQVEKSCNDSVLSEIINLLEKIKARLSLYKV